MTVTSVRPEDRLMHPVGDSTSNSKSFKLCARQERDIMRKLFKSVVFE